jgi:hypothetical protein
VFATLALVVAAFVFDPSATAQTPAPAPTAGVVKHTAPTLPPVRKFKAVDADNHTILINRPGLITLVLGTSEDSQDAARAAGKTMYPLQGRPDFQLIVVVDLRNSIATWAPSLAIMQMRSNLDEEAIALKPYYLKNGNRSNPRNSSYVIPDFSGTICPQLDWPENSDDLRGILFGADGREIKRWDKLDDMNKLLADIHASIQTLDDAKLAKKAAAEAKPQGSKLIQPPTAPPPLPPIPPDKN